MKKQGFCLIAAAMLVAVTEAGNHKLDYFYEKRTVLGPSMWLWGNSGLTIYTTDGSVRKKHVAGAIFCTAATTPNAPCRVRDVISDGHKYVWAAVSETDTIAVFDIDTGDLVASMPTCVNPSRMEYQPLRQELWVQCWVSPNTERGDIQVYSTNSLSMLLDNGISLPRNVDRDVDIADGVVVVDPTLPNIGFATSRKSTDLFELDLNRKRVSKTITLGSAGGGLRSMHYCSGNKHLFIRAYVCCTCEGAQSADCSSFTPYPVNITTGPNAGTSNILGICGSACAGTQADTVGVQEYNTVTGNVVTDWQFPHGNGGAFARVSPKGDYIVLLGNDGGNNARVLRAGEVGTPSTAVGDLLLNFQVDEPNAVGVTGVGFVQDDHWNMLVFTSTHANFALLVDLNKFAAGPHKVELFAASASPSTPQPVDESDHNDRHQIAWSRETNQLWITLGDGHDTVYILQLSSDRDVTKTTIAKNIPNLHAQHVHFVENYERSETAKIATLEVIASGELSQQDLDLDQIKADMKADLMNELSLEIKADIKAEIKGELIKDQSFHEALGANSGFNTQMRQHAEEAMKVYGEQQEIESNSVVAITALLLALVGLTIGTCACVCGARRKTTASSSSAAGHTAGTPELNRINDQSIA